MTMPIYLSRPGIACALGEGIAACRDALFADDRPRGLREVEGYLAGRRAALGIVDTPLPALDGLPKALRSRNNALLAAALAPLRDEVDVALRRFGAQRVAVVIGTSTSGIAESERALLDRHGDYHYGQQEMGSPARCLATLLGSRGPAYVVSTACSSAAKALAAGARLLQAGLADVVIAGGSDSLCRFTVAGFAALDSVDAERCNPFSRNRRGINIGEGAALFLLGRDPTAVQLAGWGESADAHHMSAPEPGGTGALAAMRGALDQAKLPVQELDYINLHGTATPLNDAMESRALAALGARQVPCSSTKPLTGHALGAAGAIEAALCWMVLADNPQQMLPPHWNDGVADPELPALALVAPGQHARRVPRHVLSNSFAFGGSNASLLLSAAEPS